MFLLHLHLVLLSGEATKVKWQKKMDYHNQVEALIVLSVLHVVSLLTWSCVSSETTDLKNSIISLLIYTIQI